MSVNIGVNTINIYYYTFLSLGLVLWLYIVPITLSDPIVRNDIKRMIRFHTYILQIKKLFHSEWT